MSIAHISALLASIGLHIPNVKSGICERLVSVTVAT